MTHCPNNCALVLALDIGNVCLKVEMARFLAGMGFESMEHLKEYDPAGQLTGICHEFERGRLSVQQFLDSLGAALPEPRGRDEMEAIWALMIGQEIDGMQAIVQEAQDAGLKVVFLSDICPLHLALAEDELSFFGRVDGAVLSFEVGELKPHDAMYVSMEENYCNGRPPLLYADDREDNIAAARKRDWPAYTFGSVQGLRKMLLEQLAIFG